jgi:hypothetical protein
MSEQELFDMGQNWHPDPAGHDSGRLGAAAPWRRFRQVMVIRPGPALRQGASL